MEFRIVDMTRKLVRLGDAVRRQRWIRGVPCWCRELRLVGTGLEIDCPIETVLGVASAL